MVDHLTLLARHGIRKLRRIRDGLTGNVEDLYRVPRAGGGTPVKVLVPPSRAQRPHDFLQLLLDKDAELPEDPALRKDILIAMAAAEPEKRVTRLSQPGWAREGALFSAPGRLIGKPSGFRTFQPKRKPSPYQHFKVEGSLAAWQDGVAKPALFSSVAILAISAAFGAPLMKAGNMNSFEMVLFAGTRTGKTLCSFLANSVLGMVGQEFLKSWLISDAALQELLSDFNDMLLVIDDLNTMKGSRAQIAQRIEGVSYAIATGMDVTRHSSFKAGEVSGGGGWRGILLTTAEWSIAELASKAGTTRQPGAAVRLIDVPALYDGATDIFDRVPDDIGPLDRLEWSQRVMVGMRNSATNNHGVPFDDFIKKCIKEGANLTSLVEKAIRAFTRFVQDPTDTSVHRDLIRKFAIVYAGASLAIRFGILPWRRLEGKEAIGRCYRAARALIVDEQQLRKAALRRLDETLRALPALDERNYDELPAAAVDGYRFTRKDQDWALIRVECVSRLLGATCRASVLEWLASHSVIRMARVVGHSPRPKDQFTWVDGKRRRSYQINLTTPRG